MISRGYLPKTERSSVNKSMILIKMKLNCYLLNYMIAFACCDQLMILYKLSLYLRKLIVVHFF